MKILCKAVALVMFSSTPVLAQSSEFERSLDSRHSEGRIALTIPFGGSSNKVDERPRVELISRNYRQDLGSSNWILKDNFHENKFGVSLNKEPVFLLNGNEITLSKEEAHLDENAEAVLIIAAGLALAVGLTAIGLS